MRSISPGIRFLGWAVVGVMVWSAFASRGPFRWALDWQSEHLGFQNAALAFFGPLAMMMVPLIVKHRTNLIYRDPDRLRALSQTYRHGFGWVAKLGWLSLAVAVVAGGLGYLQLRIPPTLGEMNILAGDERPPSTDLVTVTGLAMTDMSVMFDENPKVKTEKWTYVPMLSWRTATSLKATPNTPIRYFLKTKQTEWTAKDGGLDATKPLRRGTAPFVMTTGSAQIQSYRLPSEIRANFEMAGLKIDNQVKIIEESSSKDLSLYWGVVLIALINAFACGRTWSWKENQVNAMERRAARITRTA